MATHVIQYPNGGPGWKGDSLLTADFRLAPIASPALEAVLLKLGATVLTLSANDFNELFYFAAGSVGPEPKPVPVPAPPPVPHPTTRGVIPTSMVDFSGAGSWSSGDAACREYTRQACVIMGIADTTAWSNGMATIASRESASNSPQWQVNTTDSNAIGAIQSDGAPFQCSRGGWQCIPQTFAANHVAGTSYRIYDPVANVAAAMTYVMGTYGVSRDGSNLASNVQQADPNRAPRGY